MTSLSPPLFSALFALLSVIAAAAAYVVNRRTLVAKLFDRLYDLDKLILSNAGAFQAFAEQATRPHDDYFRTSKRDEVYYKMKAITYFYLNLFDEIHAVYGGSSGINSTDAWESWKVYMFERLKHPLIRELIVKECAIVMENGRPVTNGSGSFTNAFAQFLCVNHEKWSGKCDPDYF